MAVIPDNYPLVDGNVLDVAQWNRKIFSLVNNEGILSEPNGGLDATNLAANFRVRAEHIWPGEQARAASEWAVGTLDFYSDAFNDDATSTFITIPGASSRFEIPYTASLVIYQWSLFASVWRFTVDDDPENAAVPAYRVAGAIDIGAGIDGAPVANHTIRRMPETAWSYWQTATALTIRHTEQLCAQHYDQFHAVDNVVAGVHEVDARVRAALADSAGALPTRRTVRWMPAGTGFTRDVSSDMFTRITVGVRSAGAIVLL